MLQLFSSNGNETEKKAPPPPRPTPPPPPKPSEKPFEKKRIEEGEQAPPAPRKGGGDEG